MTKLTLVTEVHGHEVVAASVEAVCSFKDNFNRRLGRQIAIGRARKVLENFEGAQAAIEQHYSGGALS